MNVGNEKMALILLIWLFVSIKDSTLPEAGAFFHGTNFKIKAGFKLKSEEPLNLHINFRLQLLIRNHANPIFVHLRWNFAEK